jgi:hypothetical protein
MAFNITYMAKVSTSANTLALSFWTYNGQATGADDTVAEISASGYFNDFMQDLDGHGPLQVGDTIMVSGSDANAMVKVTAITPAVTTSAFAASSTVGTGNITDGAVTLAKLAPGVTPSHIVKFAGKPTTSSGVVGSTHVVTVTGAVAATDIPIVSMVDNGTANVTIVSAVVTTDTLTVTFSAAPGADVVYAYEILRAAA